VSRPRLLIEEWLPAAAIGVECMRARGTSSALEPTTFLHVWWARKPLTVSRAAVLASVLPAGFDRPTFERLLGFGLPGSQLVLTRQLMDTGVRVPGGFGCARAFSNAVREQDLEVARREARALWGESVSVLDPMAGGGSIPLESARLGLETLANEVNPVALSILEATVDYPFRFGGKLVEAARRWGHRLTARTVSRLTHFFRYDGFAPPDAYIFTRTVPCPDTGLPAPLVPDWSLSRPAGGKHIVAEPVVTDAALGRWTVRVRDVGPGAGQLSSPPRPTYARGRGWSLFTGTEMPADYIKSQAQQGNMGSVLYAVVTRASRRLEFRPPTQTDLDALADAERELARLRPQWERDGIIPTELYPDVTTDKRPRLYGMARWADMFSPRQLLVLGTLVEELCALRPGILAAEGPELGEAVVHLLAFVVDKVANYGCILSKWECTRGVIKGKFDRHDYAFRPTFAEMAVCAAGRGLEWPVDNVLDAFEKLASLPKAPDARPVRVTQGSAANLAGIPDGSITAVVVDPPYADNVQYSELADFFYVWLKRTQGHRRPEWFSTYLCDHSGEVVVNPERHRGETPGNKDATRKAHEFYRNLMTDIFREARRVLRDDGVLTVMFTHKRQDAWVALFQSLIDAGFTITACWPVKTESEHSLHQARKNAAQSTVLLAARKREEDAGIAYYGEIEAEVAQAARSAAERLQRQGLGPVDQMVGSYGPAVEVLTRYREVRTGVEGERVGIERALDTAADALAEWRLEQIAPRGLPGADPESRFYLLCWDVMQASEFPFDQMKLLGHAVGVDPERLKESGLVERTASNVRILPARERRRERPVRDPQEQSKEARRRVHPQDAEFATAIDACQALALCYQEAGGGQSGIGAARSMALRNGWTADGHVARLMEALVRAAPPAVRFPGKGKTRTAADEFPEFRAWHALLKPLFNIEPPKWEKPEPPENLLSRVGLDELREPEEEEEDPEEEGEE